MDKKFSSYLDAHEWASKNLITLPMWVATFLIKLFGWSIHLTVSDREISYLYGDLYTVQVRYLVGNGDWGIRPPYDGQKVHHSLGALNLIVIVGDLWTLYVQIGQWQAQFGSGWARGHKRLIIESKNGRKRIIFRRHALCWGKFPS